MDRLRFLAKVVGLDRPLRILDVGANPMDRSAPYQPLLDIGLCHVIGFDPQEETIQELGSGDGGVETYLPYAVGDGSEKKLNLYHGTGLASFFEIRPETLSYVRGLRRAARKTGETVLQTKCLSDMAEVSDIDFLKIDVQGAELEIFRNAQDVLSSVTAIQTEVSFYPLYENQPSFGEVDLCLREFGFLPFNFVHIVRRIVLSRWRNVVAKTSPKQVLDGDMVYLRDFSKPDTLSLRSVQVLSLLAESVLQASDLTLRCLDILERRGAVDMGEVEKFISEFHAPINNGQ